MITYILLVEDDTATRMTIGRLLEQAGYCVTTAPDGEIAIQLIETHHFDVVLTDINLRYVDGFEVLRAAHQQERPASVVFISGNGRLDSVINAMRAGAIDYLIKPCKPADLLERIHIAARLHASKLVRIDAVRSIMRMAQQLRQEGFYNENLISNEMYMVAEQQ